MVAQTREQIIQNLRSRMLVVRNQQRTLLAQNMARIRRGDGGDIALINAANLENTKAQAFQRLINLANKGFIFSPGQITRFVGARVRGDRVRISFERKQRKAIDRLAGAKNISRGEAARSIRFAKAKLRRILGNRPMGRLTVEDVTRLSPRDRAALNIKVAPKRPEPVRKPTPTKKPFEKQPGIVFATPQPKGRGLKKTVAKIRQEVQTLQTKKLRGTITSRERIALAGASLSLVSAETGLGVENILRGTAKLSVLLKDPEFRKKIPPATLSFLKNIPSEISKSGKTFGLISRTAPERATGIVAGNIVTFIGSAKAITILEKGGTKVIGKAIAKDIKTTPVGTKIIKNVKGVGDIEVIPRGKIPKLKVDPLKAVREAKLEKQLRTTPKIPETSQIEKEILGIVKKRGDAVTGSFAQQTLLKKQFARKFKDIDIVTKNQEALKKAIKAGLKGRVRFTTLHIKDKVTGKKIRVIRVIDKRTNKIIADLDPISLAEEGFIKKFGITKHKGLRIVRPEARLAAKVKQLEKITRKTPPKKIKKIRKDIEALTGGRLKPVVRGGFGFSKKELQRFVGKVGPITTAQINLLGKGIFKSSQLKVKRWLFASPFNPKTGRAQFRVSRLGINKDNEARLLDLLGLGDDISFRKSKPQIFVFPKEKIFAPSKKIKRAITTKTPKGFVVPKFSSELEVVLGKGFILKRGKTLSRVNIEGRIVPIIELKKIRISNTARNLLSRRSKTLNKLIKGKISVKQKRSLRNKLKRENLRVNRRLKKETGLDYNLKVSPRPKRVRVFDVKSKGLSALARRRRRISRGVSFAPVSRRKAIPPSRPKSIIKRPPKSPPISPPKRPPVSPPVSPPKKPPRIPPKGVPRPGVPIRLRRKIRRRKPSRKQRAYNVFARPLKRKGQKKRPKLIRVNKKPLTKKRAEDTRNYILDTSLARTGRIIPTRGRGRRGRRGVPIGYSSRTKPKFRTYRIVRGRRRPLKRGTVIERGKRLLDTRQERSQISLRKRISQINKSPRRKTRKITSTQRRTMLRNLAKARRVKARKNRR